MTIWSLVGRRVEDGCRTGVARFDAALRSALPGIQSVTSGSAKFASDDIVIADNHMSLQVPPGIRTVVVHQGCAQTHYERDPVWRTSSSLEMVRLQRKMFDLKTRSYVAPSVWVMNQFDQHCAPVIYRPAIIPNWAAPIERLPKSGKPRIIGDWRDNNKGSGIWKKLAAHCPQWDFGPLNFRDDAGRRKQYGEASLYLCLSLSEGGAYAVCDAEAAELPIVTTDVGNYREFADCHVIHWTDRENLDLVAAAIEHKLSEGRRIASYFRNYSFNCWRADWERVVRCA